MTAPAVIAPPTTPAATADTIATTVALGISFSSTFEVSSTRKNNNGTKVKIERFYLDFLLTAVEDDDEAVEPDLEEDEDAVSVAARLEPLEATAIAVTYLTQGSLSIRVIMSTGSTLGAASVLNVSVIVSSEEIVSD
jgi:hypothetical protein